MSDSSPSFLAQLWALRSCRFHRRNATKQIECLHLSAAFLKALTWSLPTEIIDCIEDGYIESESCQCAKQQDIVPAVEQRFRQQASSLDRWMPFLPIFWNLLQMRVLR